MRGVSMRSCHERRWLADFRPGELALLKLPPCVSERGERDWMVSVEGGRMCWDSWNGLACNTEGWTICKDLLVGIFYSLEVGATRRINPKRRTTITTGAFISLFSIFSAVVFYKLSAVTLSYALPEWNRLRQQHTHTHNSPA